MPLELFNRAKSVSSFISAITTKAGKADTKKQALNLARLHKITETQQDNTLTGQMLNPEQLKGESLIQRLGTSFESRIENTTGLEKARCLSESINTIYHSEFKDMYQSLMQKQAEKIYGETVRHLKKLISQQLNTPAENNQKSLQLDILSVLEFYKQINEASKQVLLNKSGQLEQVSSQYNETVNSAQQELARFDSSSWWQKLFRPFLPKQICQLLEEYGLLFLENELQILACRIAIYHLLEPLNEFIEKKINNLSMFEQKLNQIKSNSEKKEEKIAKSRSVLDVPLGFELTDSDYLNNFYEMVQTENRGRKALTNILFKHFISKKESISAFLDCSAEKIQDALVNTFKRFFEPMVQHKDVCSEFLHLYPEQRRQLQILRSLVKQTEGRILSKGEVNKNIIWLKFLTVPNEQSREHLQKLIQKADPKPGTWHVIVDDNQEDISAVQIRGGICLSSLLNKDNSFPVNWEQRIKFAFDPVAALLTLPNPDNRQLSLVLTKAVVNNQLFYDNRKGFYLNIADNEPIYLGNSKDKVKQFLKKNWPVVVRIESTFGWLLVSDETKITHKLDQLSSNPNPDHQNKPELQFINETSIQDLKHQIQLLSSWSKVMRQRRIKE